MTLTRREVLAVSAGAAAALVFAGRARAAAETRAPALYVYHGSPLIAVDDARVAELTAWSQALASTYAKPKGIVALTPHVRSVDAVAIGHTGPGTALMSFPSRFRAQLAS